MRATATIASAGLAGGVTSKLSGGEFWDGARNGLISASLNHVAHGIRQKIEQKRAINISERGLEFIKKHESFRSKAYRVGGKGNLTIGYGHEILPGENFDGGITKEQALELLSSDVEKFVGYVNKYVKVPLNQHQFDATVSYVFNAGQGNTLIKTQFVSILNSGNYSGAAQQIDINTSGGVYMQGLENRRIAERNLFMYGKY